MRIVKILNNNAVISKDENGKEIVVMGRGIAFKHSQNDLIDNTLVTGIFSLKNQGDQSRLSQLAAAIPYEYFNVAKDISIQAEKDLNCKLDDGLILRLADHIFYTVEKLNKHISTPNLMLSETKRFYPKEYQTALNSLETINDQIKVQLDENEAGFIAFHIVNCEDENGLIDANEMIEKMQRIIRTIEGFFDAKIDEESLDYSRFIVHLKFFVTKMMTKGARNEKSLADDSLYEMLVNKYSMINRCLDRVNAVTMLDDDYELTDSDRMYLIIHLARLIHQD